MFTTYLYIITMQICCETYPCYICLYVSTHPHNCKIIWVCLNMSLYFKLFLDFLLLFTKNIWVCSNIPVYFSGKCGYVSTHLHNGKIIWVCLNTPIYLGHMTELDWKLWPLLRVCFSTYRHKLRLYLGLLDKNICILTQL